MSGRQDVREGSVAVAGIRLSYREWDAPAASGAGLAAHHLPLLLLHGLASAARIWDLVAPPLALERRVVALDQRGHGRSDKPDDGYDFATIVRDDIAAADALELGERFLVAGHSWGANVALELAAAHPDRVAALALVDGGFGMLRQRPNATWERISEELAPPHYEGTPRETYLGWMRASIPDWRPELDDIALNIVQLHDDDTVGPRLARASHMRILRAMWDEDPEAIYGAIRCPVLYVLAQPSAVAGESDGFLTAKQRGIELARKSLVHAPRVEVEWMPDTVHDIPLQRPEALAQSIGRFLASAT